MDADGLGHFGDPAVSAGVRLGPGTLYGALSRLEQRGLVKALAAQDRATRTGSPPGARGRCGST
jgi:Fe2+ or Zn2+ uptake regulation protein